MKSPLTFREKVHEKGLACTLLSAAVGSVLLAQEIMQSIFQQLVEKAETSDDSCVRTVRDWLDRRERRKTGSSW